MQSTCLGKLAILVALLTTLSVSGRAKLPVTLVSNARASPDGRWKVTWHCQEAPTPKCGVTLSRVSDGHVFFQHSTFLRYIEAASNSNSTKCIFLDAPDNANTLLWLFRIRNQQATAEKLDYEAISMEIERTKPHTRRSKPSITRSGIEKISWESESELRLYITYNSIPVVLRLDTSTSNLHITVLP
jgi:hypothetical protein